MFPLLQYTQTWTNTKCNAWLHRKDRMKFFPKTQQKTLPDHQTKETRKVLFYDKIFLLYIQHLHHSEPHIFALARALVFFRKQQETSMHTQTAKQCSCKNLYFFPAILPIFPFYSCRFQFSCNKVKGNWYVLRALLKCAIETELQHCVHATWSSFSLIYYLFWIIIQTRLTTQYTRNKVFIKTKQFLLKA